MVPRISVFVAALFIAVSVAVDAQAQTTTTTAPVSPRVAALIEPVRQAGDGGERVRALITLGEGVSEDLRDDPAIFAVFVECAADKDSSVRSEVARTMGQIWIWGSKRQKPEAIELGKKLAHDDDPEVVHNTVYFCLSTAQPKTDDVIRAMFDAAAHAADYDPVNLHGRIAWGLQKQPPKRIAVLCEPYWAKRDENEKSAYLIYKLYVQITGQEPPQPERFAAIKAKVATAEAAQLEACRQRIPALAREIAEGDAERRIAAFDEIGVTKFMWLALDESILDALVRAADDPNPRVRAEVARLSGNRWIWSPPPPQQQPHPKAIKLALKLVKDPSYDVRDKAIYFGLSTIRDPSDEVIRALLDSAITATEGETTSRIVWGLRSVPADRLAPFLQPYFDKGGNDAARASQLFSEITSGKLGQIRFTPVAEPATQAARPAPRP